MLVIVARFKVVAEARFQQSIILNVRGDLSIRKVRGSGTWIIAPFILDPFYLFPVRFGRAFLSAILADHSGIVSASL